MKGPVGHTHELFVSCHQALVVALSGHWVGTECGWDLGGRWVGLGGPFIESEISMNISILDSNHRSLDQCSSPLPNTPPTFSPNIDHPVKKM